MTGGEQLKFVTKNFRNLQGLYWAAAGAIIVLVAAAEWRAPQPTRATSALVCALTLALLASCFAIRKYYTRRFGRIRPLPPSNGTTSDLLAIVALVSWALAGVFLRDDSRVVSTVMVLWVAGFWLSNFFRAPRYRPHWFALTGGILFAVARVWMHLPEPSNSVLVLRLLVGVAVIVGGFTDHAIMTRLIPTAGAGRNE